MAQGPSTPTLGFAVFGAVCGRVAGRSAVYRATRMCGVSSGGEGGAVTRDTAGFLVVNKPLEWTSFDVVNKVRGTLERRLRASQSKDDADGSNGGDVRKSKKRRGRKPLLKCGHGGTLDPAASGVLILGVGGDATRTMGTFLAGSKSYSAVARFGHETDTLDREGTRVGEDDKPFEHITRDALEELVASKFTGAIMQVPPAYSAIRVGGKRAHDMARSGEVVELDAREVTIHSVTLGAAGWLATEGSATTVARNELELRVECGGGTYIRSLVRDIARELGSAAYMSALVRTAQGPAKLGETPMLEESELADADAILGNMAAYNASFAAATSIGKVAVADSVN